MLTVGEFSKLCKVSSKTLRYYDSIDLIKPAKIDEGNEYRYYTFDQLERMILINKLKKYQFPLVEILSMLNKEGNEYLIGNMKQKYDEMVIQIEDLQQLQRELEKDIAYIEKGGQLVLANEKLDIGLVETTSMSVVFVRRQIKEGEGVQLFNELGQIVERYKLNVCGELVSIYYNNEYDDNNKLDMEVCAPVSEKLNEHIRIMEGGLCIYTRFIGRYEDLPEVYISMFAWKEAENYELIAPPYQKYIVSGDDKKNSEKYITDIFLPVKKK